MFLFEVRVITAGCHSSLLTIAISLVNPRIQVKSSNIKKYQLAHMSRSRPSIKQDTVWTTMVRLTEPVIYENLRFVLSDSFDTFVPTAERPESNLNCPNT